MRGNEKAEKKKMQSTSWYHKDEKEKPNAVAVKKKHTLCYKRQ